MVPILVLENASNIPENAALILGEYRNVMEAIYFTFHLNISALNSEHLNNCQLSAGQTT